jgi:hypothetical protein
VVLAQRAVTRALDWLLWKREDEGFGRRGGEGGVAGGGFMKRNGYAQTNSTHTRDRNLHTKPTRVSEQPRSGLIGCQCCLCTTKRQRIRVKKKKISETKNFMQINPCFLKGRRLKKEGRK